MTDVTALGELLIDFACQSVDEAGYPTMAAHPGGAPGNFLASLTAYGCSTAMLSKVGGDAFGRMLLCTLKDVGVDVSGVVVTQDVFTTLAFVTIDDSGNRSFSFARKPGADTQMTFEELALPLIDGCRDFHFGTLSLTHEPARTATQRAVAYAKGKGKIISFDPNLRLPLWADPEEAKKQILWGLAQADIVKISDEETAFLFGDVTPEEAARRIHALGAAAVFVTLGSNGAWYFCADGAGHVPAPVGIRPVDTTGAGDIFGGSAVSCLLKTGKPLAELTAGDLREAAAFACCAASLSTQQFGGISSVPAYSEVIALAETVK